jgi:hypothetical protein
MTQTKDLRGSRRELAVVFGDAWKTPHEVAIALGRPTGSIFGVLRRMHADGLLVSDCDPETPTRGTQYRLSDVASEMLADAPAQVAGVGRLAAGQRLMIVERRKARRPPARVLMDSSTAGLIAWAAEMPDGWVLVMTADADPFRIQRLAVALEKAGCRCREAPVDSVLDGPLLRERASTLLASE